MKRILKSFFIVLSFFVLTSLNGESTTGAAASERRPFWDDVCSDNCENTAEGAHFYGSCTRYRFWINFGSYDYGYTVKNSKCGSMYY